MEGYVVLCIMMSGCLQLSNSSRKCKALIDNSLTFTFSHLADAFIQSDLQERALQKVSLKQRD